MLTLQLIGRCIPPLSAPYSPNHTNILHLYRALSSLPSSAHLYTGYVSNPDNSHPVSKRGWGGSLGFVDGKIQSVCCVSLRNAVKVHLQLQRGWLSGHRRQHTSDSFCVISSQGFLDPRYLELVCFRCSDTIILAHILLSARPPFLRLLLHTRNAHAMARAL